MPVKVASREPVSESRSVSLAPFSTTIRSASARDATRSKAASVTVTPKVLHIMEATPQLVPWS